MRLAAIAAVSIAAAAHADTYLIGNSLTWDSQPALLDGSNGWHIDCNKSLPYIFTNPSGGCVSSSTDWSLALSSETFAVLSVQPFGGVTMPATLAEDADAIAYWMTLQPAATVVIHTGWTYHSQHETVYHGDWDGVSMTYCPAYFDALRGELLARHPGRTVIVNDMLAVMDRIYHDIERGVAPYAALEDIYRDPIHLTATDGRFLAHNRMRQTLGQPFSSAGFVVEQDRQTYLLAVIEDCPADFDRDRDADVFDLLGYLRVWFDGGDVRDLLDFVGDWFAGC